jgi:hypothetical protein
MIVSVNHDAEERGGAHAALRTNCHSPASSGDPARSWQRSEPRLCAPGPSRGGL